MQRGVGGYIEGKEEEKNRLSSLSSGGAHGGCFGRHTGIDPTKKVLTIIINKTNTICILYSQKAITYV